MRIYILKLFGLLFPSMEDDASEDNTSKTDAKRLFPIDIKSNNKYNLKIILEFAKRLFDEEEKRITNIESKSVVLIGSTGVITVILFAVPKDYSSVVFSIGILHFICTILSALYFCIAIIFAIKCLERQTYHKIGPNSLLSDDSGLIKSIIADLLTCIRLNYKVINTKVDYMAMAHAYFKRGIIVLLLNAGILLYMIYCKSVSRFICG